MISQRVDAIVSNLRATCWPIIHEEKSFLERVVQITADFCRQNKISLNFKLLCSVRANYRNPSSPIQKEKPFLALASCLFESITGLEALFGSLGTFASLNPHSRQHLPDRAVFSTGGSFAYSSTFRDQVCHCKLH